MFIMLISFAFVSLTGVYAATLNEILPLLGLSDSSNHTGLSIPASTTRATLIFEEDSIISAMTDIQLNRHNVIIARLLMS